jgi:hypothetical protein
MLLVLTLAGLTVAAPAQAQVTRKKAMWGPLLTPDGSKPTWPIYADLGVGIFQYRLDWKTVATERPQNPTDPEDPAYDWPSSLDDNIQEAGKYGIEILLMVRQTPEWSNGVPFWWNSPKRLADYGDFLEAAAKRYPRIRHWMVWGEPSRTTGLNPPVTEGASFAQKSRERGQYYARMLDMAYGRLKRVSRSNLVIGGNSYDQNAAAPGFQPARRWVRNLKLPNGKPPRLDMYGHNPFSSRSPNLKQKPRRDARGRDLLGADFADLDTLHKDVNRFLRRKRGKKIPIFVSEYALQTDRDSEVFNFHVSRETQAKWLRQALRTVRRSKWIYSFGYFRLNDTRPDNANDNTFPTWGLMSSDLSEKKPGYFAFKRG